MKQMSRNISALAMGIGVVLLWAVCPMQAQLRLSAIADVNSEFPNDVLHDNVGFVVDQGKAAASLYVVFDLSQVPAGYRGSEIVAAVLETPSDASAGDIIFDVMLLGGPWDPNKLTYNSQPPFVKKLASRLALGGKTGVLQIDVTQQLRDWLDGTQPNYGVAFVPTSDSGSGGLTILPAGNSPAHAPIVIRPTYRSQAPDRVQSMISHVSQPIVAQSAASPRAGQSGQGQSQLPAVQRQPLTNADVIRIVKAGVPESTIVPAVQSSPTKFNLSPDALVELTRAGVTQKIMDAMMARGSGGHTNNQRMRLQKAQLKLKLGPKIRLSGSLRTSVDPAVTQALLEQSRQAHSEKASAGHLGATRTPASNPSRGAVPAAGHVSLAENSRASNQIGPSRTLSQSGTAPSGASSMPGESAQGLLKVPPQQSRAQMIALGQQPLSICQSVTNTQPGIETVSGRIQGVIFTPDPGKGPSPNNQYTIKGCHFGAVEGNVHIFGAFLNNPSPVKLGIDSWNDALIVVTFDPTFQNEYDLNNITLVVVTQSGTSAQLPGNSFLATRVSQPLTRIPNSLVKLPSTYLQTDDFISPATPANLQNLGLTSPSASAVFYQYDPLWSTNVGDGYPLTPITWSETIDFSKLRSGFALDVDIQTVVGSPGPLLENGGLNVSEGSCKYSDISLAAQMNGSVLGLGVQPAECDNSGKFIFASYGLALSVTGPKGEKLSPWPENL